MSNNANENSIIAENEKKIQKRVRKSANKKWAVSEELEIINYLKQHRNFEKPTAQVYYKKFLEETQWSVDWQNLRSKVRNMKVSYKKAKDWENSTGAGSLSSGETITDVISRMCWFFEDFEDLFYSREIEIDYGTVIDSAEPLGLPSDQNDITGSELSTNEFIEEEYLEEPIVAETQSETGSSKTQRVQKGIYSRTAVSDILASQNYVVDLKREKLQHEKEMREKEYNLEREKFVFEKEKASDELKLKERLAILELEMKERVAMKELEMKERLYRK